MAYFRPPLPGPHVSFGDNVTWHVDFPKKVAFFLHKSSPKYMNIHWNREGEELRLRQTLVVMAGSSASYTSYYCNSSKFWKKNVTWHSPPLVSFGDTFPYPPPPHPRECHVLFEWHLITWISLTLILDQNWPLPDE